MNVEKRWGRVEIKWESGVDDKGKREKRIYSVVGFEDFDLERG